MCEVLKSFDAIHFNVDPNQLDNKPTNVVPAQFENDGFTELRSSQSCSSDDTGRARAEVTLFPNPVSDYLLVSLGEYVPAAGSILIVDMQGKAITTHPIYYGQNTVDLRQLPIGTYAWQLRDGDQIVREGKIVKK